MVDRVVGAVVNDVQAGDLMFVDRAGQLREMDVSSLSINHVTLTGDVAGIKTYTMYRSADDSVIFGTFDVRDGADGTGSTWPDYNNGNIYSLNQVVVDDDQRVYRCIIDGTTATKPQVGGIVNVAWQIVNVGGLDTVHVPSQDYAVGSVVLVGGDLFTPAHSIAASVAVPVPFAQGRGVDEWYLLAEGQYPLFSDVAVYAANEVVRVGASLFQANSVMDGSQGTAIVFVEGYQANEWRPIGTRSLRMPETTRFTTESELTTAFNMLPETQYIEIEMQGNGGTCPTLQTNTNSSNTASHFTCGGGGGAYVKLRMTREAVLREFSNGLNVSVGIRPATINNSTGGAQGVTHQTLIANGATRKVTATSGTTGNRGSSTSVNIIYAGVTGSDPVRNIAWTSQAGIEELDWEAGGGSDGLWILRLGNLGAGMLSSGRGGMSRLGDPGRATQAVAASNVGTYDSSPVDGVGHGYGAGGKIRTSSFNQVFLGKTGGRGVVRITEFFN